jgi:virulence-associated protein VapD
MRTAAAMGHNRPARRGRVYAITFDLDTEILEQLYPNNSWRNAYTDIRKFLEENGFEHKQGSVYFAVDDIDALECVAVVQDMAEEFNWLTPSLRDMRMLRIEDNNDLMIVLDRKRRKRK